MAGTQKRGLFLFLKGQLVEQKLGKVWFYQSSLNFGYNNEVLKWAARSGCKMVFIGLESSDNKELRDINKKINLQLDYKTVFKNINKHDIAVLGAFIFGFENETLKSRLYPETQYRYYTGNSFNSPAPVQYYLMNSLHIISCFIRISQRIGIGLICLNLPLS